MNKENHTPTCVRGITERNYYGHHLYMTKENHIRLLTMYVCAWNYKTHCKLAIREGFLAVLAIYHSELTVLQVCTEIVRPSDHLAALIGASDSLVRTLAGVCLQ